MNSIQKHRFIPEIVAPAGSPECFSAALNAGADAVYAGVRDYNMRAGAKSYSTAQINSMIKRAHDAGTKLYLAINVIAYDEELKDIAGILDKAADAGVDAVILWDTGILRLARERNLPVHLSTQASVSNYEAVRFYSSLGVQRIVLARELSLKQLKKTIERARRKCPEMEFESFVHGAMCIAISGWCLTSQFLHKRSANRGDCIQPCRWEYKVTDLECGEELVLENNAVLSAIDLCTIDIMDRIIETGVNALKIEGRMCNARYVKTAVECYREARDAVLEGGYSNELVSGLKKLLSGVFNRGFSHGFYIDRPDNDIAGVESNISTHVRAYAGRVVNYFKKAGAADIKLEAHGMTVGDTVLITGPTTDAVEFEVLSLCSEENQPVDSAERGDLIGLVTPALVRENDRVYVIVPREEK